MVAVVVVKLLVAFDLVAFCEPLYRAVCVAPERNSVCIATASASLWLVVIDRRPSVVFTMSKNVVVELNRLK